MSSSKSLSPPISTEQIYKISSLTTNIINNILNEEDDKEKISRNTNTNPLYTKFNIKSQAKISLENYINRIVEFSGMEFSTVVIALCYLEKVCEKITLTAKNQYNLIGISLVLALKYNQDITFDNMYLSKVLALDINSFIKLENTYLDAIDFELYVFIDTYKEHSTAFTFFF